MCTIVMLLTVLADLSPQQEEYLNSLKPGVVRLNGQEILIMVVPEGDEFSVSQETVVNVKLPTYLIDAAHPPKQATEVKRYRYHVVLHAGAAWYLSEAEKKMYDEQAASSIVPFMTISEMRNMPMVVILTICFALGVGWGFSGKKYVISLLYVGMSGAFLLSYMSSSASMVLIAPLVMLYAITLAIAYIWKPKRKSSPLITPS